jgi:hypothetical protein
MSSDDDMPKAPEKSGEVRVLTDNRGSASDPSSRPTLFYQLRSMTIPPILLWMAQRIGSGHGPWTTETEPRPPPAGFGIGRRLLWAAIGASFLAVGLVIAFLVLRTGPVSDGATLPAPPATESLHPPHSELQTPVAVPAPSSRPEPDEPAPTKVPPPSPASRKATESKAPPETAVPKNGSPRKVRQSSEPEDPERNF